MDRRAVFFLVSAIVCLALVPVTPDNLRYVGFGVAIADGVLGLASLLDYLSRTRSKPTRKPTWLLVGPGRGWRNDARPPHCSSLSHWRSRT